MRIRYSKPEDIHSEENNKMEKTEDDDKNDNQFNQLKNSLSNKNLITSITSNLHSIQDDELGHEMLVT